jgi:hypothetical protein
MKIIIRGNRIFFSTPENHISLVQGGYSILGNIIEEDA